jgi:hypothetical protein
VKHQRGGGFVGLSMLSEYMLMSRMVNLGVNVDNGSIQIGFFRLNIILL